MQKKKKKNKLFIFLIICFVIMPFLFTKGCSYMESLNQAENSISEPISSASAYSHIHEHSYNAQGHSIRKANWTGTAVPSSGYVENIYFNENSTSEENFEILTQLNYITTPFSVIPIYVVFANSDLSRVFFISEDSAQDQYGLLIADITENVITNIGIFYRSSYGLIDNEFDIDSVGISNYEGIPIGQQNELINFLSITPFEQSSNNELSISNLFTQLGNAMIIFGSAVVNLFISMEPIFWNNGPTLIFILLIAAVSFALVFWGIELLISLIGVFKTKRKKKKWRLKK